MQAFESIELLREMAPALGVKFLVAVLCGGAIGLERETSGKPAGLRTNILICLGSTLFTAMSVEISRIYGGDAGRLTAQIVSGIGFLGAGAILHRTDGGVKGMTTAALIWLVAAIGVVIGTGFPLIALAFTIATVVMILGLRGVEMYINNRQARSYRFQLPNDEECRKNAANIIQHYHEHVRDMLFTTSDDETLVLAFRFSGPATPRHDLIRKIHKLGGRRLRDEEEEDD